MTTEMAPVPVRALYLVEQFATPKLLDGRVWDLDHTKAVVYHASRIATEEHLDALVLITVAWLHDTGYTGKFNEGGSDNHDEVEKRKESHMEESAKFAKEFLSTEEIKNLYTDFQKNYIVRMVAIHDQMEKLTQVTQIAFMEADTLGQIDVKLVTPTFGRKQVDKYIFSGLKQKRWPRFFTHTGKRDFRELYPKFLEHFGIPMEGDYKLF